MHVVPFAREPNITALCEMDLSPGTVKVPLKFVCFLISIRLPTVYILCSCVFSEAHSLFPVHSAHRILFSERLVRIHGYE